MNIISDKKEVFNQYLNDQQINTSSDDNFDQINDDNTVFYFCYINEHIDYLEELFNRKIQYKYGLLNGSLITIDNNNFSFFSSNCIHKSNIDGIVVKITKNELLKIEEINNDYMMLYIKTFVNLNEKKKIYLNCYYLCSMNYSKNIPSKDIINNRYKILLNCKNIYPSYKINDLHFYYLEKYNKEYFISWNPKNNYFTK